MSSRHRDQVTALLQNPDWLSTDGAAASATEVVGSLHGRTGPRLWAQVVAPYDRYFIAIGFVPEIAAGDLRERDHTTWRYGEYKGVAAESGGVIGTLKTIRGTLQDQKQASIEKENESRRQFEVRHLRSAIETV